MKIVIAPDKFKGSLSSLEFCSAVEKGIGRICDQVEILKLPLADGGDGTIEIANYYLGGSIVEVEVNNEKFKITQPKLRESDTGSLPIVKEMTEAVFFYGLNANGSRYMQLQPTRNVYCKCAIDGHFKDPNGEQLKKFNVGTSPEAAYKDLILAFNNKKSNPVLPKRKVKK